jgi:hypothetical protein
MHLWASMGEVRGGINRANEGCAPIGRRRSVCSSPALSRDSIPQGDALLTLRGTAASAPRSEPPERSLTVAVC